MSLTSDWSCLLPWAVAVFSLKGAWQVPLAWR